MNERLQKLQAFLAEEPNDPFLIYAIATEYQATDMEKAREYFEILLTQHEDYVATYYHAAHLYFELGMDDEADKTYLKGIEKATAQKEDLALRELKNAYQNFQFERD